MARIYWKPKELEKVADWLIERGYRSTDVGIYKPTLEAQKQVLPPDRWRNIPNNSGVLTLREVMADREKMQKRIEPTPDYDEASGQQSWVDKAMSVGPITAPTPLPFGYIPPSVGSALGEHIASVIISAVTDEVDTIVNAMKEEIRRRVDAEFGERAIRKPDAVQQKQRLPSVVIVGPWPSLFGQVKQEFDAVFDLELVGPDESLQQLQSTCKKADHVLVMTSKVSHKHTDALKAVGVKAIEFGGGLSAMRDILTRLFVEEKAA